LFDKDHFSYEVILVTVNQVQAVLLFGNVDQLVHFDNITEVKAAIALKVGVEESEEKEASDEEENYSNQVCYLYMFISHSCLCHQHQNSRRS
jgi:hypothetical protein